jgi:diguanylate cyclase (GGDEF)-like protein
MANYHDDKKGVQNNNQSRKPMSSQEKSFKYHLFIISVVLPLILAVVLLFGLFYAYQRAVAAGYSSVFGSSAPEQRGAFVILGVLIISAFLIMSIINKIFIGRFIASKKAVGKSVSEDSLGGSQVNLINHKDDISDNTISTENLARIIIDTAPSNCQLWDDDLNLIGCNKAALNFHNVENEQSYIKRFFELSPEHQPNGQPSANKFMVHLKKALKDGRDTFEWMYQSQSGGLMPAEIAFVRIDSENSSPFIIGYTNDMRRIEEMTGRIAQLEAMADKIYYDELTKIYNRRFFDENALRTIRVLSRSSGKLSLLMIDIDCFKKYNETYGHTRGDECLKLIAKTLSSIITRTDDFVTRYEEEAFAVILPNTNESGARFVAHKLLESVRDLEIPHESSLAADFVTVSIGVTTGNTTVHTQNIEDYVKRANEMLQRSKKNGRNRYMYGGMV